MAMLRVANCPSQDLALTNAAFVNAADAAFVPYAELGDLVLFCKPHDDVEKGTIALNGVQRKLLEQGRKQAEQQAEAAKMSLKNHSEELAVARKQLQSVQEERDAAHGRIAELQATQQEHEQVMNSLQERLETHLPSKLREQDVLD